MVLNMKLLMIDNYDSFTYNLVQLFYEFDLEVIVFRHDQVDLKTMEAQGPDWICISPGPKTPAHSGISQEAVRRFGDRVPILGVCLGMQVINEVFGGETRRAPVPVHGKCSQVHHNGQGVLAGLPSPFLAARYHSLQIIRKSSELITVAEAPDGVIMAVRHESFPIHGVQFHPESFLTEYGLNIVQNFLRLSPKFSAAQSTERPDFPIAAHEAGRFPRWNRSGTLPLSEPRL